MRLHAVLYLLLTTFQSGFSMLSRRYFLNSTMSNYTTCAENNIIFGKYVRSLSTCCSFCSLSDACAGVFYTNVSKLCIGCSSDGVEEQLSPCVGIQDTVYLYEYTYTEENGWLTFNGSAYRLFTVARTMENARVDCRSFDADLLHINSEDENIFISNNVLKPREVVSAFIGLAMNLGSTWTWVDDGTLPGYTHWGANEPDGFLENCAIIVTGGNSWMWYDTLCFWPHVFICEKNEI